MYVAAFLQDCGQKVVCCTPDDDVYRAAAQLMTYKIGAMSVCDKQNALVGVVSEGDIVKAVATLGGDFSRTRISEIMTAEVITCDGKTSMHVAILEMMKHHIDHLVVVDGGKPIGMLSISEALKSELDDKALEAFFLQYFRREDVLA